MEDNIGKIVSYVHGTNDVLLQTSQRYILEKNLFCRLKQSEQASRYHEQITTPKRQDKLQRVSNLDEEERHLISHTVGQNFEEFEHKTIDGFLYEVWNKRKASKTCDSFAVTKGGLAGRIRSIFTANNCTYFLLSIEHASTQNDICASIQFLERRLIPYNHIIKTTELTKKAVFMEAQNIIAYSIFPNQYERD